MDKKKVLLIVNPKSGKNKNRASSSEIAAKFGSDNYEFDIRETTCSGDATNIVKNSIGESDMVVCCGGDGTFNETINGVMTLNRRVPIGYIPAGSTNDLANTIGIPSDIDNAVATISRGNINQYDIGLFNNRFFSYIASFGVGTNLSYSTPQKMKNKMGHAAYMINGFVLNLVPTLQSIKPKHIKIEYDGKTLEDNFFFGSISNSTSVAGLFKFDKNDVKLDDGKFEVLLVRRVSNPLEAFPLLGKIKRMEYDGDKIIYLKCTNIKMTFDEEIPWTLDGEFGGNQKEIRFSVLNRAIDIISDPNPMFIGPAEPDFESESPEEKEKREEREEKKLRRKRKDKSKDDESDEEPETQEAENIQE